MNAATARRPAHDGPPPPDDHWVGRHPLADEHAVLLHEVLRRGRAVRTALSAGRSPDRDVAGLVDYLRYEVLDQAVTAERLLFPLVGNGLADDRIQALVRDHVRLRDLTDQLSYAVTTGEERPDPQALVELLDSLDDVLDRHLRTERQVLSGTTSDGVESLRHPFRCHLWFPLTEGPEVDLDVLPRAFAHRAVVERLSRLRPGERLIVRSRHDLDDLWNTVDCRSPGEYGWAYLEEGPGRWRAEVTVRTAG
jgi:uncharacterized protein (DUF2249 family)/hemerythrin-like domain-containing protein